MNPIRLAILVGWMAWAGCQAHSLSEVHTPNDREEPAEEEEEVGPTRIVINVPSRQLMLFEGEKVVFHFPVAVGSPVYKTPLGPRSLSQVIWNPWWYPPDSPWAKDEKITPPGPGNPLGPVKMELGGDIRLHGTSNELSVGHAVSHGCMRMYNSDAKTMAWWIQSHFSGETDPLLLEKYAANRGRSFAIPLKQKVPVEIQYDLFAFEKGYFYSHPDLYGKAGNRKRLAYDELEEVGFSRDQIDEGALDRILAQSGSQSAMMMLKELVPGKLVAALEDLPDPVDESWRNKTSKRPFKGIKVSTVFSGGMQ